ncbi:MAG: glutamate formimidoyltransferase [Gaiellales bacterium]|nr:glutamate formimidoyltransferase [Gaiellales bacterium]
MKLDLKVMECVPNVSEGRDLGKVGELADLLRASPGISLLHVTSDADHNRSVFTCLGEPRALLSAATAFCARAFELIDMRQHTGCHPRMGAVDVVPFVPLGGTTMVEAVAVAHELGEAVGAMGVPVYFYEEAALQEERRNLADVRRGEYECLPERANGCGPVPDAGPHDFNPRSGACLIGARRPLIAFNVNLGTADVTVAQTIARTIRESSGGMPAVKALGVELKELGIVQVSMNLVDYRRTGMHQVLEAIRREAARFGVPVLESELIGLLPLEAVEDSLRHCLQMREFDSSRIIEAHLLRSSSSPESSR